MGLETAMRHHPVEARRQAESGESVHCSQECQIGPVDGALPEQCYCQKSTEKGKDHYHKDVLFRVGIFHKTSMNASKSRKSGLMILERIGTIDPDRQTLSIPFF